MVAPALRDEQLAAARQLVAHSAKAARTQIQRVLAALPVMFVV